MVGVTVVEIFSPLTITFITSVQICSGSVILWASRKDIILGILHVWRLISRHDLSYGERLQSMLHWRRRGAPKGVRRALRRRIHFSQLLFSLMNELTSWCGLDMYLLACQNVVKRI